MVDMNSAIEFKERHPWVTADLSIPFVKSDLPALLAIAFISHIMLALLIYWVLPTSLRQWLWLMLAIWWCKPIVDRLLLHRMSSTLFGQNLGWHAYLSSLPKVLLKSGLLSGLLWRRASPVRSYVLPLWQLEGQKDSKALRKRNQLIKAQQFSTALLVTMLAGLLELLLMGIIIFVLAQINPDSVSVMFEAWLDSWTYPDSVADASYQWVLPSIYVLASALVAPFYVAAGFMLYVNRRTRLEGWDIELQFKKIGARLASTSVSISVICCIGILAGSLLSQTVAADQQYQELEVPANLKTADQAQQSIERVYLHSDLKRSRLVKRWVWKGEKSEPTQTLDQDLIAQFSMLLKLIFIVALLVVATLVLKHWLAIKHFLGFDQTAKSDGIPDQLFGLDLRKASLPNDIPQAVKELWRSRQYREALSLLYRACLSVLTQDDGLPINAGHTEGDILHIGRSRISAARMPALIAITGEWKTMAYAKQVTPVVGLESLLEHWVCFNTLNTEGEVSGYQSAPEALE